MHQRAWNSLSKLRLASNSEESTFPPIWCAGIKGVHDHASASFSFLLCFSFGTGLGSLDQGAFELMIFLPQSQELG